MNTSDKITGDSAIKSILEGFVNSYAERDKSVDFSNWLAGRLQEEMPDMSDGEGLRLSEEIIEAVAEYDRTLGELNEVIEAGQSKEEWLVERTFEACGEIPYDDAGIKLQQIEHELDSSNTALMRVLADIPETEITVLDAEDTDWNEYSLKSKAIDIGKQAVMAGLGVAANVVKVELEGGGLSDVSDVIGQALRDGMETATGEVKAVVAGAVKTAAEKGLTDILPADTSTEGIADLASAAVEGASALFDVAVGKSTMTAAMDRAGRATVAAVCRWAAGELKGWMITIPYVGPLLTVLSGGLFRHMNGPKFSNNVYIVVRDAAIATWEGIKESGRKIWRGLKNAIRKEQEIRP